MTSDFFLHEVGTQPGSIFPVEELLICVWCKYCVLQLRNTGSEYTYSNLNILYSTITIAHCILLFAYQVKNINPSLTLILQSAATYRVKQSFVQRFRTRIHAYYDFFSLYVHFTFTIYTCTWMKNFNKMPGPATSSLWLIRPEMISRFRIRFGLHFAHLCNKPVTYWRCSFRAELCVLWWYSCSTWYRHIPRAILSAF